MCAITEEDASVRGQEQVKHRVAMVVEQPLLEQPLVERPPAEVEQRSPPAPQQPIHADILAYVTQKQKFCFQAVIQYWRKFAQTRFGRILTSTTQPAHVLAILGVIVVACMFMPGKQTRHRPSSNRSTVMGILFVFSIGIHIGAQFWMTFISGLALYFSLPRHAFGDVQKVLFPHYFTLNSILSALTLISLNRLLKGVQWETRHWLLMLSIGTCFLLELLIRLYAVPVVLKLITMKTEIEKKVPGVGREIGEHNPGRLSGCPYYNKLHSNFRRFHLFVAGGNIATIVCTCFQVVYICQCLTCL